MDYIELCEVYQKLESNPSGLEKISIISQFLDKIKNNPNYIYLFKGRIFPDYDSREFGISIQLVTKAISRASGFSEEKVTQEFKRVGDLGIIAYNFLGNKKVQTSLFSEKLNVKKVLNNLQKISEMEGQKTVSTKINLIVDLLHSSSPLEAKFIIRIILSDLKIGVGDGILRDSIVEYNFKYDNMEEKKKYILQVQELYDITTDWALVFDSLINNKIDKISLSPGRPVKVMLYPKAKDLDNAFDIVGRPAALEYKYDGFRVMINKDSDGRVRLFTRRLEEVSEQFPDVVETVIKNVKAKNFIIDSEVIGYDPETHKYTDFQAISQRIKRKYDIKQIIEKLPVELKVFDVIFYDDKSLINETFIERRKVLEKIIISKDFKIGLAKEIITDDNKIAEEFFNEALNDNQEGLMIKGLDKPYKPGARVGYGVKLKPQANDFDLVITGAEWGTGKRAGWLTSFDLSCKSEDELLEIGKASTGPKEKKEEGLSFEEMTDMLKELIISENGRKIKVRPEIVVTIKYQNVQTSPTYSSGFALRFPRIVSLRPDRNIDDIATIDEILE
jgi:DNA ligase-1